MIIPSDLKLTLSRDARSKMKVVVRMNNPVAAPVQTLVRYYLRRIMTETRGNITHAAERLGTSRRSLRERLKKLGLYGTE